MLLQLHNILNMAAEIFLSFSHMRISEMRDFCWALRNHSVLDWSFKSVGFGWSEWKSSTQNMENRIK